MGIVAQMIESLRDLVSSNNLHSLRSVTVDVGEASMVVPRFLSECWDASIYDTEFKDTKLILNIIVAEGKCSECGTVFKIKENDRKCPHCGATDSFVTVTGRDLEISQVEALDD